MITVIGSANIDIIVESDRFPMQGETVRGKTFATAPGGKGANQAVASARLGEQVQLIGSAGTDDFGRKIIHNLQVQNVITDHIQQVDGPSGTAVILLSEQDNRIISIPGANHALTPIRLNELKQAIQNSSLIMMQLELPEETVRHALELCREAAVPVLMDPSPASSFKKDYMKYVTWLTPNETECAKIFGLRAKEAVELYPNRLLVTLGSEGVVFHDGTKFIQIPAIQANTMDTTGAGDTFNGALASRLVSSVSLKEAIRFANAAASLSVEKFSAQGGMPAKEEVEKRLLR